MVRRDTGWLDSRRHDDDTLAYMTGETGSGTTILIWHRLQLVKDCHLSARTPAEYWAMITHHILLYEWIWYRNNLMTDSYRKTLRSCGTPHTGITTKYAVALHEGITLHPSYIHTIPPSKFLILVLPTNKQIPEFNMINFLRFRSL